MKKAIIVCNILVILISFVLLIFSYNQTYNNSIQIVTLLLIIIPSVFYILDNNRLEGLKGSYIRISYLFLVGYFIVFFQYNIDLALGFVNISNNVFASPRIINTGCIYATIGLSAFYLGNAFSISAHVNNRCFSSLVPDKFILVQKLVLLFFTCLYIKINGLKILSGDFRYTQDYLQASSGTLANYSSVMIYVMTFTILVSNVYNIRLLGYKLNFWQFIKKIGFIFFLCIILYLSFIFMIGDRGPLITILLAIIISYITLSKIKIKLLTIVGLLLVGGLILTSIGQVRKQNNFVTLSEIFNYNNIEQKSIVPLTSELAGSYNTFTYSISNVPENYSFFYGAILIREVIYSVPFLSRIVPFAFAENDFENSSAGFCTYLIQGRYNTYGNGTSLLADIYLDFGIIGIIIIMFFWGKFIRRLDYELYNGFNMYIYMIALIFFSFSLYISRSSLITPLYYLVPSMIVLYLNKFFKK